MHEPYYRREVASALSPLVTKKGARLFALPNADSILVTADLTLDDLAAPIRDVQKRLRESKILAALDPVIGITDPFIEWFDLEEEYGDFAVYVERLVADLRAGVAAPPGNKTVEPRVEHVHSDTQASIVPKVEQKVHDAPEVDLAVIGKAMKDLRQADIGRFVRAETIYAIAGRTKPVPVFIHQHLDLPMLVAELAGRVDTIDHWLKAHVLEDVMPMMLELYPQLETEASLGTSFRVTCSAVLSKAFDAFDSASRGKLKTSRIIEFSLVDALTDTQQHEAAHRKVEKSGYKVAVADVEPMSLRWLNPEMIRASFIKLHIPEGGYGDWLSSEMERDVADRINKIGRPRFILDGCNSTQDIELGQRLGITLFQGDVLS